MDFFVLYLVKNEIEIAKSKRVFCIVTQVVVATNKFIYPDTTMVTFSSNNNSTRFSNH